MGRQEQHCGSAWIGCLLSACSAEHEAQVLALGKHLPSELSPALGHSAGVFSSSLSSRPVAHLYLTCLISQERETLGPNEQGGLVSVVTIQRWVCAPLWLAAAACAIEGSGLLLFLVFISKFLVSHKAAGGSKWIFNRGILEPQSLRPRVQGQSWAAQHALPL